MQEKRRSGVASADMTREKREIIQDGDDLSTVKQDSLYTTASPANRASESWVITENKPDRLFEVDGRNDALISFQGTLSLTTQLPPAKPGMLPKHHRDDVSLDPVARLLEAAEQKVEAIWSGCRFSSNRPGSTTI